MRNLDRNKQPLWYCLYEGKTEIVDDDGYGTGEFGVAYAKPVRAMGHVTAASGDAAVEQFGIGTKYDKVVQLQGTDWPIEESTVLFVDHEPPDDFDPSAVEFDYTVTRVSKSLNQTSVAISKVR